MIAAATRVSAARSLLLVAALNLGALQCAVPPVFGARAEAPSGSLPAAPAAPAAGAPSVAAAQVAGPDVLSPQATRDLLATVTPPRRDEADLERRYKEACGVPTAGAVPLYLDEPVGTSRPIWVLDDPNHRYFQVQSTLRYASAHLLLYVQDGVAVNADSLAASADVFEQRTWPMLRRYFGELPVEPRITLFSGRVPGVGGYFSASDMLPTSVNRYSNQRAMIFMNLDGTRPGTAGFDSTLAHETQHLVHYLIHPQQESWVNEGASELAMAIAGYSQAGTARRYVDNPETQLDSWAEQSSQTGPYYGGGYLFLEYFAARLGGYERIKELIATPGVSTRTFDTYLGNLAASGLGIAGGAQRFDDLFRDFVVANVLNDRSLADGRYGYDALPAKVQLLPQNQLQFGTTGVASVSGALRPYATRYLDVQPGSGSASGGRAAGDLELRFSGAADARLYNGAPHSGRAQWWGNAADDMEATLTRELDLTAVDHAALTFSAWYDTERDYDYAGVAVSADNGCTWQTLPGRTTTDADPLGQNLGHAFTGHSGGSDIPVWVDEVMDLTPYAGKKVLLRFFNVTDQSYHGSGLAVDDIAVPEIGFYDDAETDQGWDARGFLRSVNAASLDWAVQAIAFSSAGTQVLQLPLTWSPPPADAPDAPGRLSGALVIPQFGAGVSRVVVAISPLIPVTQVPVDFSLEAAIR